MSTLSLDPHATNDRRDFMPLHGIDHIELWVGNAAQAAYYFRHAFGFTPVAPRSTAVAYAAAASGTDSAIVRTPSPWRAWCCAIS